MRNHYSTAVHLDDREDVPKDLERTRIDAQNGCTNAVMPSWVSVGEGRKLERVTRGVRDGLQNAAEARRR